MPQRHQERRSSSLQFVFCVCEYDHQYAEHRWRREEAKRWSNVRKLEQHVDLAQVPTALNETIHHVLHPCGTLTARCTLTARLMLVELGNVIVDVNDVPRNRPR